MRNKTNHTPLTRGSRLTDAKLLLIITICVFVVMYLCAVLFLGSGFKKPQTFFNILNENAALLILSCGMSLVMITGGIDISVGTLTALVCMSCAVNLDFHGGTVLTAILLALGIGTAFGLVQGFLIAYLEIQPFIVTLAGMFFAKGMTTIVNATQFNVENEAFKALKETRIYVPGMGSVNKLGAYVPAYVEIGVVVALLYLDVGVFESLVLEVFLSQDFCSVDHVGRDLSAFEDAQLLLHVLPLALLQTDVVDLRYAWTRLQRDMQVHLVAHEGVGGNLHL